jgi:hypothetical protein
MRIGKSLLLGSAAGIAAVAGAQAADLPVKAKPVEYVKVCSLYGAGFFYIPGTDKCIKIGGLLREQWDIHGAGDGFVYMNTTDGSWTRGFTSDSSFRARSVITFDVREQSSYGTIRGYSAIGAQQTTPNDPNSALFFNRSFVQFAGFTGGRAVSFFDFISYDPYGYSNVRPNLGNTGATGIDVFAYTAQFGNGVSGSISAEDSCATLGGANNGTTVAGASPGAGRKCLTVNTSVGTALAPGAVTYAAAGYNIPDIVASLRVDQAWGSAQIMGAYHKVAASYYGVSATAAGAVAAESQNNGHPTDEAGWAVGAGFLLKNVMGMQGDAFGLQANYAEGAMSYITGAGVGPLAGLSGGTGGFGNSLTFGHVVDAVYTSNLTAAGKAGCTAAGAGTAACGSGLELTKGWTIGGIYEHKWNPQWKSSLYGGYVRVEYSDTAANYICNGSFATVGATSVRGGPAGGGAPVLNGTGSALTHCDPNLSFWSLGTRTQWNPNSNLDLGVDVVWNHLESSHSGVYTSATSFGNRPAGAYSLTDYDILTAAIRAQYNFLP